MQLNHTDKHYLHIWTALLSEYGWQASFVKSGLMIAYTTCNRGTITVCLRQRFLLNDAVPPSEHRTRMEHVDCRGSASLRAWKQALDSG